MGSDLSGVRMKNIKPSTSISASTSVIGLERRNERDAMMAAELERSNLGPYSGELA